MSPLVFEWRRVVKVVVFRSPGWLGIRVGRFYFKLRDVEAHPLRFSERHGYGYRRLLRVGEWELGVTGRRP